MEVLSKTTSESPVLLSNIEVMKLLEDRIKSREGTDQQPKRRQKIKSSNKFQHRDWIEEKVHAYLQTTPCVSLQSTKQMAELKSKLTSTKRLKRPSGGGSTADIAHSKPAPSAPTSIGKEVAAEPEADDDRENAATTGFGLTDAEAIQVLNFMPSEPVEIHLMIEELNARLSQKRQEELLELIQSYSSDPNQDQDA